ncbi:MAG: xanthine dehydrogenase accessory protein XdhC [Pseudomonadota bacterium]
MLDTLSEAELTSFVTREPSILVEISEAKGSTPRVAGTCMVVSSSSALGTIGGGQLEYMAVEAARDMLAAGQTSRHMAVPLGPAIGQCCGGHVSLELSAVTGERVESLRAAIRSDQQTQPHVYLFGAGHVGRALADALRPLPLQQMVIDVRKEELALLPPGIPNQLTALPEEHIRRAPAGSAVIVLTHDHALDFLLAGEALAREDLSYVGMIGSKTKRATFVRWLKEQYGENAKPHQLTMPIGAAPNTDKRPAVIAALVAAELLSAVAVWHSETQSAHIS